MCIAEVHYKMITEEYEVVFICSFTLNEKKDLGYSTEYKQKSLEVLYAFLP